MNIDPGTLAISRWRRPPSSRSPGPTVLYMPGLYSRRKGEGCLALDDSSAAVHRDRQLERHLVA